MSIVTGSLQGFRGPAEGFQGQGENGETTGAGTVTQINTAGGLTGGPITTTGTITLADTAVSPGTYADASVTVDQKGRITAISANSGPQGTVTQVQSGTGLTGGPIVSSGTLALANTAVTPGSYTNADITVDQQGRITAAASGSTPTESSVSLAATYNGTVIATGTVADVPTMSLTLQPGTYILGYTAGVQTEAAVQILITDNSNVLVPGTIGIIGSLLNTHRTYGNIVGSALVTIVSATTYKLRFQRDTNNDFCRICGEDATALFTNPDTQTRLYAIKLA